MFSEMKPHEGYRASGITWMPQIPEHWRTQRLKTVVSEKNVKGFPGEPLLAATQARGVILKAEFETRTVEAQKSLETLKLVDVNDFVISLRSFQGGIERSHARGIISPAYTILKARKIETRDYLTLLFKSRQFIDALKLTVTGIREGQNIEYPRLARELVALPPEDEQVAIVKYLAHAHVRIDRTIAAKRKLIALLDEQKEAVIQQAVTRGLDPSVPLKDSGISWLGEVPASWEVLPGRKVFTVVGPKGYGDEDMLSVTIARGVVPQSEYLDGTWRRDASNLDRSNYRLVRIGDLVYNKMRAWQGAFGFSDYQGIVSPAYVVIRPQVGEGKYWHYLMRTSRFAKESERLSYGITSDMWSLRPEHFKTILFPIPPIDEQREIVSAIEATQSSIEVARKTAEREVALLREFRSRLTSDVVTGKLDVREIAATLPELKDEVLPPGGGELSEDDNAIGPVPATDKSSQ